MIEKLTIGTEYFILYLYTIEHIIRIQDTVLHLMQSQTIHKTNFINKLIHNYFLDQYITGSYIYMYIFTHKHMYMHISIYLYECMYVCMNVSMYV